MGLGMTLGITPEEWVGLKAHAPKNGPRYPRGVNNPSPRWVVLVVLALGQAAPARSGEFVFTPFSALVGSRTESSAEPRAVAAGARSGPSDHAGWSTSPEVAKKRAKAEGKRVLLFFTGSDWCPHCIAAERELFSKDRFLDYADREFVLVLLDFPMRTAQAPDLKAQNEALLESYGVQGFPTVVILRSDGKEAGRFHPDAAAGLNGFMASLEKTK